LILSHKISKNTKYLLFYAKNNYHNLLQKVRRLYRVCPGVFLAFGLKQKTTKGEKMSEPFYLRGEARYATDHHKNILPEPVREAIQRLIDSGEAVIQTARHTISGGRALAYVRGNKQPSDTLYTELTQTFG
jgi:hypothetical protein